MNIPKPNIDTKRIKSREAMIQYKKSLAEKNAWDGDMPMGEGPLNRDGMPKIPPGQRVTDKWPVLDLGFNRKSP